MVELTSLEVVCVKKPWKVLKVVITRLMLCICHYSLIMKFLFQKLLKPRLLMSYMNLYEMCNYCNIIHIL